MSPQPLSNHMPPSTFKKLLWILFLVGLAAVLLGCKPSAAPSTLSPLPTPSSTPLSSAFSEKPIPSVVIVSTPLSSFPPARNGIPAGTGTLVNEKAMPPFWMHDFVDENIWYKDTETGTLRTTVYSGFMLAPGGFPTQQGVVVVEVMKMDSHGDVNEVYYRLFPTPTQSGSVHITDAIGERLILQATNGTSFYFDVPSRQFVTSMTVVVPTATVSTSRLPTPTPAP